MVHGPFLTSASWLLLNLLSMMLPSSTVDIGTRGEKKAETYRLDTLEVEMKEKVGGCCGFL